MRNPSTAFETNASTTTLATFNQNKFFVKGKGLNKTMNQSYTFGNNNQPMNVMGDGSKSHAGEM